MPSVPLCPSGVCSCKVLWYWGLALGGVLYAYGRYTERVDTLQKTITKAENNERAIIGIEKDLEYLKDGMDKILRKLE